MGHATRVAGVSFFRAFDEAGEGPDYGDVVGCVEGLRLVCLTRWPSMSG